MDMKSYLRQASEEEREALALSVNSSVGYLYLIAGGHRRPGTDLCKALVASESKLTLHELRPDVWAEPISAPIPSGIPEIPRTNHNGEKAREAKAKPMVGRMKIDTKNIAQ
jgi:hypothetical protein